MSEQNKFVMYTVAAEPRSDVNINNEGPHILIEDARNNQNMLGFLPVVHPDEPNWACILPLQQPYGAPEGGSYAGMNTPAVDQWYTFDELSPDLLAPNMRFAVEHLEEPGAAVGFNYSPDPRIRDVDGVKKPKFKPNSWDHFHMHWMTGVDSVTHQVSSSDKATIQAGRGTMDVRPHRYLSELLPHVIEGILEQEYRNPGLGIGGLDAFILNAGRRKALPYRPEGGIIFSLPGEVYADPVNLGRAIKGIHAGFIGIHQNIWDIFVANYRDVQASGWTAPYVLRPQQEIADRLVRFSDDENIRKGMARFFSLLRPERHVPNPMNWLYKGPSHSLAAYKHENNYILSLLPHVMHPTNWLAALGIFEVRQAHSKSIDTFRERAQEHVGRLVAASKSFVAV